MREYSTPPNVVIPDTGSLTDDLLRHAHETPERPLFARRTSPTDSWIEVSARQFLDQVQGVAAGLIASGVTPGDRVALLSKTRYEWTLIDYANWYVGAVTVPIYETSSDEQVAWILQDSGAKAIIVESSIHLSRVQSLRAQLPALEHVWAFCDDAVETIGQLGVGIPPDTVESRRAGVLHTAPATVIYTSGTTGKPKGCVLTHENFMFELGTTTTTLHELFDHDDAATLLFLPLAHVFARIIQVGCMKTGARMGHSSDIKSLVDDLASYQPTFILAVPRVFEKIFNTSSQRAVADGKGKVFDRAAKVAIQYSRALDKGRPSPALAVQHRIFDKLVYAKLRQALGGKCTFALSGGAPLGERLGHFYRGMGVPILEGYGLTETTAALTVNLPDELKIGSVGRPLPGTAVRVADDGELLFQGGQVFHGYWQDDSATAEAFDDGWFKTGDLGEIDDEGFVRITGRKKEIIVTAGGKNVAPGVLEDRMRAHPLVDQVLVVGDGRPFIAALITLDRESLREWATARGKSTQLRDLLNDPDVLSEIDAAVTDANTAVSRAESIRKYEILRDEWTEEAGHLTPSLKLRRNVVRRKYADAIESLYTH